MNEKNKRIKFFRLSGLQLQDFFYIMRIAE
jgi:hypothetical protein